MSLRQVLTIYNAERQLTDDETALLNTLRRMNDNERQMFVEGLSGKATKKAGKKSSKSAPKSQRASSLQQQIQTTTRTTVGKPVLCTYEINGKVCHGTENDGIHDPTQGYAGYHEFQPAEQAEVADAAHS